MNERFKKILEILYQHISTPVTELNYINPYTLLVAVTLSAQATDKGVNKVTDELFLHVTSPQEMLSLGEEALLEHVRSLNYYKTKASNLMKAANVLVEQFGGEVPDSREALMTLPGVGRKTANVVLNVGFQQPTIPVDTHVMRVAQRLGLTVQSKPDRVEADLEKIAPEELKIHIHHLLILHGRYTCKARRPLCEGCVISHLCPFYAGASH